MKKHSFTLMEMLVVIAIVGLVSATATPALLNMKRKRELKTTSENVRDSLIRLHSMALAANNATDGAHYMFRIGINNTTENKITTISFEERSTSGGSIITNKLLPQIKPTNLYLADYKCLSAGNIDGVISRSFTYALPATNYYTPIGQVYRPVIDASCPSPGNPRFVIYDSLDPSKKMKIEINRYNGLVTMDFI